MTHTNEEWRQMAESLAPLLSRRDLIGYAAAVNTRRIGDATAEYARIREELIEEYGTLTDNTFTIIIGSPEHAAFERAIAEVSNITQDVDVMLVPRDRACGELTGEELLDAWWMFDDTDVESEVA